MNMRMQLVSTMNFPCMVVKLTTEHVLCPRIIAIQGTADNRTFVLHIALIGLKARGSKRRYI